MECACAHTKITEIRWYVSNGDYDNTQSGKFMCLDCNTDFIPVTPDIRRFLYEREMQARWDAEVEKAHEPYGGLEKAHPPMESPPDTSWAKTEDVRRASRARHGVDCSCSRC